MHILFLAGEKKKPFPAKWNCYVFNLVDTNFSIWVRNKIDNPIQSFMTSHCKCVYLKQSHQQLMMVILTTASQWGLEILLLSKEYGLNKIQGVFFYIIYSRNCLHIYMHLQFNIEFITWSVVGSWKFKTYGVKGVSR